MVICAAKSKQWKESNVNVIKAVLAALTACAEAAEACAAAYERMDFTAAGEAAMSVVRLGNRQFDEAAPWANLGSDDAEARAAAETSLLVALETVRVAAVMLRCAL